MGRCQTINLRTWWFGSLHLGLNPQTKPDSFACHPINKCTCLQWCKHHTKGSPGNKPMLQPSTLWKGNNISHRPDLCAKNWYKRRFRVAMWTRECNCTNISQTRVECHHHLENSQQSFKSFKKQDGTNMTRSSICQVHERELACLSLLLAHS